MSQKKNFFLPAGLKVAIFYSGRAILLLKLLYVCPVFRNNLVLCLFNSDGKFIFLFLLFGFVFY